MQTLDGTTVYAATDLVGYLECEHLTTLERAALEGAVERPLRDDPELRILQERGLEHEQRFLAHLRDEGLDVLDGREAVRPTGTRATKADIEADAARTGRLMRQGVDVIYQGTLFDGTWLGYVDFLRKVPGASSLGEHHYEVIDTKLARRTKGSALLQMCVYSELLEQVQGRMPERMHVALGGAGGRLDSHRLDDYLAYFRSVKRRFLASVEGGPAAFPLRQVPVPVSHCGVCRWDDHCSALRTQSDHLSLVAGIRNDQVKRLEGAGIGSLTELAQLDPVPVVNGIGASAMRALHDQARLQHASRTERIPKVESLPLVPGLGFSALPQPDSADLFFDIEGDPYAEEDGLEYLLGIWDPMDRDERGAPLFRSWWAHTREEERVAFESFIDFVMDRWRRHPTMHVYHYAAYERSRMGQLSTRHATREAQVDAMLRGGLFVDLYRIVRQSLRIGTASYSIKKLEPLYALERDIALRDAGSSIVRYEEYIRSVSAGTPRLAILDEIAAYNRDDCRSNQALRDWLETRREALERKRGASIERLPTLPEPEYEPTPRDVRIGALVERLLATVPVVREQRAADPAAQGRWLVANLLEWHRREEKVEWWAFFDRCSRSDAELVEDEESIGELTYVGEVGRPRKSVQHRYRFDPAQPYRLKVGDAPCNPATGKEAGRIVTLDPLHGVLDLEWGAKSDRPHPTSLIPRAPLRSEPQKAALERLGEWVEAHDLSAEGSFRNIRSFLLHQPPDLERSAAGGPILAKVDSADVAAPRLVLELRTTVLPVQGAPGSGKTYTGAEMILALVQAGRQVGITAFTHRALTNLLSEVLAHADSRGRSLAAIRKIDGDETPDDAWPYLATTSNDRVREALRGGEVQIAAGTSWLWARSEFEEIVDTLFVDEAGQLSLANVAAVAGSARNVVLLGDPQQLSQVKKGAHPEGVDVSALEFVLRGGAVIPPERGLFLPSTHRLHPDVNQFTSSVFYEGKLTSAPEAARQGLTAPGRLTGTGVRWIPVIHRGNSNASEEEATAVAELYGDLLRGSWVDHIGQRRAITPRDILVVSPYNAQVELLRERVSPILAGREHADMRVGTVDKVQGQQAAVVIYSMATSSHDELPRSIEFLYSLNRLNVATSRGRCLAAIVASPDLLLVRVHTPLQMRLANALCRFVELASEQPVPATGDEWAATDAPQQLAWVPA